PFLLNATVKYHIEQYIERDPKFVAKFLHCIYVDDLTTGTSNVELGYEFYLKAKLRLAKAGFNHRKFVFNSTDLIRRILVNEGQVKEAHTNNELPLEHKVNEYLKTIQPTKRDVVGIAAKIYNSLGILSIVFKLDSSWKKLASTLDQGNSVVIDWYLPGLGDQEYPFIQLVGFCDASLNAYAAVVYLRVVGKASTSVSILASKTQVAPLKTVTIPCLQLLSALLLARPTHLIYGVLQEKFPFNDPFPLLIQ
uniref:Reverse transcriptase domain-containing protein n=1 Tax=Amphimedon queenslandica TaxID=400682 RepID=A0A1X7U6B8_AMPQE